MAQSNNAPNDKPKVVGLYGVSGSGKTHLLNELKKSLNQNLFTFYEGSEEIANIVPGGLDAFKGADEQEKLVWREKTIESIGNQCAESKKVAIVTGHLIFPTEQDNVGQSVWTQKDSDTYTHILYLNVPAETVAKNCRDDTGRRRPDIPLPRLEKWLETEKRELRNLCQHNSILFALLTPGPALLATAMTLLRDFESHSEDVNLRDAKSKLDDALSIKQGKLKTVLAMDADKTLAAMDTGKMFWEELRKRHPTHNVKNPLDALFGSPLQYSYTAWRQASLLYEEAADDHEFEHLCQEVASLVAIYPEILQVLDSMKNVEHVGAVVITCGLRRVWQIVLKRVGLSERVKVIGGGRFADRFIVDAKVKEKLVGHLQYEHNSYVWAFGDGPLDIPMLKKADRAIVVVGDEQTRSTTMDDALTDAMNDANFRPHQVVFSRDARPRLDGTRLPVIESTHGDFVRSIIDLPKLKAIHATERKTAQLLMTPIRNSEHHGPVLRSSLRDIGWYLAVEYLPDLLGLEEYPIMHVLGGQTLGQRLHQEEKTTILALMRSGEPLAFGINDAFPLAMFVHAKDPSEVVAEHLKGQGTVILVDAVVNSGKTIMQFVERVRRLNDSIRIVVVTYVAQAGTVAGGRLAKVLGPNVDFIALRQSTTKYVGSRENDTGNRLFNTTHMD